jgi:hypothetical protein
LKLVELIVAMTAMEAIVMIRVAVMVVLILIGFMIRKEVVIVIHLQ